LGLPLSFPILLLAHLWCVDAMSKEGRNHTVVFGDDMATKCSDSDMELYIQRLNRIGFQMNYDKSHQTKRGFTFCGRIYTDKSPIKVPKLSQMGKPDKPMSWVGKLERFADASHMCHLRWQRERICTMWKDKNPDIARAARNHNIPLHIPKDLGGLGFAKTTGWNRTHRSTAWGALSRGCHVSQLWTTHALPWHIADMVKGGLAEVRELPTSRKGPYRHKVAAEVAGVMASTAAADPRYSKRALKKRLFWKTAIHRLSTINRCNRQLVRKERLPSEFVIREKHRRTADERG